MAKKLVRYKNVNGTLVKQFESPMLIDGLIDISQLPVVGAMGAAVIERGSNANGEYVKWADGTMICTGAKQVEAEIIHLNEDGSYRSAGYNMYFPAAFITKPSVSAMTTDEYACTFSNVLISTYQTKFSTRVCNHRTITATVTIYYTAIGRWK